MKVSVQTQPALPEHPRNASIARSVRRLLDLAAAKPAGAIRNVVEFIRTRSGSNSSGASSHSLEAVKATARTVFLHRLLEGKNSVTIRYGKGLTVAIEQMKTGDIQVDWKHTQGRGIGYELRGIRFSLNPEGLLLSARNFGTVIYDDPDRNQRWAHAPSIASNAFDTLMAAMNDNRPPPNIDESRDLFANLGPVTFQVEPTLLRPATNRPAAPPETLLRAVQNIE